MTSILPGVQVDETMSAYARDSRLRQQRDVAPVVATVADLIGSARQVVDLGCGVGDLVAQLVACAAPDTRVLGIDASEQRIARCRDRFVDDPLLDFRTADLLGDLPYRRADVVTMTAVAHWLYPREQQVVDAVARRLAPTGVFALTTYHPSDEIDGLGGTDAVVADALGATADDARKRFVAAGVTPISVRTRPTAAITELLAGRFARVRHRTDTACTRPASGSDFASYFASTFGDYYGPLFASTQQMQTRVAEAADRRLATLGHVTSMDVRTWDCREPIGFRPGPDDAT